MRLPFFSSAADQPTYENPDLPGLRTFIVPSDIVPVARRSPIRARKRTPWRPRPEGEQIVDRTGGRDWFGEHLEPPSNHAPRPATYGFSATVHALCAAGFAVLIVTRPELPAAIKKAPLLMPVMATPLPTIRTAPSAAEPAAAKLPKAPPPPPAEAPAPVISEPTPAPEPTPPAPIEAPSSIQPESAVATGGPAAGGSAVGVPGGVAGGVPGGVVGGAVEGGGGGRGTAPMRLGPGVEPPKRIKDVKAIYPAGAMQGRTSGTVIIEAIIGVDGKVHDARVLRSIPLLDDAALDAVRQWEYIPGKFNGAPVAVIMTVTVSFSIL